MEGGGEDPGWSHTSTEMMTDLRELSIQCRKSLHQLSTDKDDTNGNHAAELMASFNIWAANMGAFREGHQSLVSQLRSLPEICKLVRQLLLALKGDVENALRREEVEEESSLESASDCSSDESSDRSSNPSYQQFQVSPIWSSIETSINSLNQLAWTVRRAGTQHRHERIQRFKNLERNEKVYQMFENHARQHFDHTFPNASVTLRKRMAESIAARRIRHSYLEQHQKKISTLQEAALALQSNEASEDEKRDDSTLPTPTLFQPQAFQPAVAHKDFSVEPSEMLSNTVAIKLDPREPLSKIHPKRSGSVSSVKISNGTMPRRPKLDPGGTSFTCPYCFHIYPAYEMSSQKQWMSHLIRDFEPFFCVFENCSSPFAYADTYTSWVAHMREIHSRPEWHCWYCEAITSSFEPFLVPEDLENHLKDCHQDQITDALRPTLVKHSMIHDQTPLKECPFCGGFPEEIEKDHPDRNHQHAQEALEKHVRDHLVSVALFLAPQGLGETDEGMGETEPNSQRGNYSERHRDEINASYDLECRSVSCNSHSREKLLVYDGSTGPSHPDWEMNNTEAIKNVDELRLQITSEKLKCYENDSVPPDFATSFGRNQEPPLSSSPLSPSVSKRDQQSKQASDDGTFGFQQTASDPEIYTVGWICAIVREFVAAQLFLEKKHDPPSFVAKHDNNSYKLGQIGNHNVVIAVLPDGEYGTSSAAVVARDMVRTFTNIRICLMVGIGGGAPTLKNDIRLGDVVVSSPKNGKSGVFQYDFGKTIQAEAFQHTKHLNQPPILVRAAVTSLQVDHEFEGHNLRDIIDGILDKNKRLKKYKRPDLATDVLYRSNATHPVGVDDCQSVCGTNPNKIVPRKRRDEDEDDDPAIHYGLIASANQLMKDATIRDRLAAEKGVLCFEMEAAGLMNHFPCLVIRGVCDYSDTHKNDNWHGYAAMTAAAYTAELLRRIPQSKIETERKIVDAIGSVWGNLQDITQVQATVHDDLQDETIIKWLGAPDPAIDHNAARECRYTGLGSWLLNDDRYVAWKKDPGSFLWLYGMVGCGKTVLASTVIDDIAPSSLAYFYFSYRDMNKQAVEALNRSLLQQIYSNNQRSRTCVETLWKVCTKDRKTNQPTAGQLYDCLVESLAKCNEAVHIVIDALDESTERGGPRGLLEFLRRLREYTKTNSHILVTSRAEPDIKAALSPWVLREEIIPLKNNQLEQDIESYIDKELSRGGRFDRWRSRPAILDEIKLSLLANSGHMFRWVVYKLESLANCFDSVTLLKELSNPLPRGLDDTYQRMMSNIPVAYKDRAMTILRFLTFSNRPLTANELVDALAVDLRSPTKFDPQNRMFIPAEVVRFCPGLVIAQPQKDKSLQIQFAHFSVREFLTSNQVGENFREQMNPTISRNFLAETCLAYLFELDEAFENIDEIKAIYPFAQFSAESWLDFAADWSVNEDGQRGHVDDLAVEFFQFRKVAYLNWFQLFDPESRHGMGGRKYAQPRPLSTGHDVKLPAPGLYYASLYGMFPLVKALLSNGVEVNTLGGQLGYPLIAAAASGQSKIVRLLLEAGADVDARSPRGHTALYIASFMGHWDTTHYLLNDIGKDGASQLVWNDSLRSAAEGGQVEIVSFLLDSGVRKDCDALEAACYSGNMEIVGSLIGEGADVNGLGFHGKSPLSSAEEQGHSEIVSFLLNHGAQPSRQPQGPQLPDAQDKDVGQQ